MTDTEVRLRIYEMAFERAKLEKAEHFLDRVETIATWLLERVTRVPSASSEANNPVQKGRTPRTSQQS
jgi:hypothetical protein